MPSRSACGFRRVDRLARLQLPCCCHAGTVMQ
jgi:hypothetical protein